MHGLLKTTITIVAINDTVTSYLLPKTLERSVEALISLLREQGHFTVDISVAVSQHLVEQFIATESATVTASDSDDVQLVEMPQASQF
jgi:hypothetical protein